MINFYDILLEGEKQKGRKQEEGIEESGSNSITIKRKTSPL